jgi:hypothetical protein
MGGYLLPQITVRYPGFEGIILMAANFRLLGEVLLTQVQYMQSLAETSQEVKTALEWMREQAHQVQRLQFDSMDSGMAGPVLNIPVSYWQNLRS